MTTSTTTGDVERAISASAPTEERVLLERPFSERLKEVVINYLPLSWITFGGPQAHIALLFDLFVTRKKWLSEKMFAELFAMSNAMPGPASTQLAFTVALVRGGVACGIIAFLIWSVPGGLVMTFLGYGVGRLGAAGIPVWFKRVQNGLAAVAVSLVALAAFKLGSKILVDKLSVVMAIIAASIVINFLDVIWIIPTMMVLGGIVTTVEDNWEVIVKKIKGGKKEDGEDVNPASREIAEQVIVGSSSSASIVTAVPRNDSETSESELRQRPKGSTSTEDAEDTIEATPQTSPQPQAAPIEEEPKDPHLYFTYSVRAGLILIAVAILFLVVAVILRSFEAIPRSLNILGTFYFVGIIIFGGGPVVVPLLYSYVVTSGWLSDSEFLIGLAVINAMPGPNFNFAAFCGALAMRDNVGTSLAGGTLAWIGIFLPGLLLKAAILPLWKEYRGIPRVKAAFKGFNSVAVGLVFAATYVLFQKAISDGALGPSLGMYPFYVAVTGVSYVLVEHLKVPAPYVVILGGVVGAVEWAVTRNRA